jgi:hypothetical protein
MPLTTGAGLDMPYSATPVRRTVSDIPWQLEKIDKSTVRNGGAREEVLAKMHRVRALGVHRSMPCQIALPLSVYPNCSGPSSSRSFQRRACRLGVLHCLREGRRSDHRQVVSLFNFLSCHRNLKSASNQHPTLLWLSAQLQRLRSLELRP